MALVTPDFSEVAEEITPGEYTVRVVGAEEGSWEKDGRTTRFIKWTMETLNEADPKNNGRRIYERTALNGKGAFRLQRLYKAAVGESLKGGFDTEQLLGKEVRVVVETDAKGFTNVKSFAPVQ